MDRMLECKIMNLQEKLKTDNEVGQRENLTRDLTISALCSPRHGSGRRPKELGDIGTPTRTRKQLDLPVSVLMQPKSQDSSEVDNKMKEIMKMNGILNIYGKKYHTDIKDLEHLGELGNGTCGHVVKMLHKPSNTVIAVKQMRRSGNSDENKRIIMDLDVVFKSLDCPYIVRYLGCFITESDVWICMELMATCFDRLLKKLQIAIPEDILGKVTFATVNALHYLKESHGVIHRDVKPSNILLDEKGNVKLCDFGISGRLVDSKAQTKNAGCAAYMAPERIEPPDPRKPDYDIRADVWSLGITLVELATGVFPYKDCKCDFEVLSRVLNEDPPSLPCEPGRFSLEFQSFVSSCLTKDYVQRPKYQKLLDHQFLKRYEKKHVDVAAWYAKAIFKLNTNAPLRFIPTSLSTGTRRQPPPPPPTLNHQSRRVRSGLENIVLNGDQSAQYSTFRSLDSPYGGLVNELCLNEWEPQTYENKYCGLSSPRLQSKNRMSESSRITNHNTYIYNSSNSSNNNNNNHNNNSNNKDNNCNNNNSSNSNNNNNNSNINGLKNTSLLVLPRYHQTSQFHSNYLPSYPNASPHYRSASLSPSRKYLTDSKRLEYSRSSFSSEENETHNACLKRPLVSFLKLQQNAIMMDDVHRRSPPTVPPPAPPSPPPRSNRISPAILSSSPLMMRRTTYESPSSFACTRKLFSDVSPSLSRRMTLCPPQPPPRRLQESSSVPGSPQHFMNFRRHDLIRNTLAPSKFQTPLPQHKAVYQMNDL